MTIGRILFGGFFIYNGINHFLNLSAFTDYAKSKGVPLPKISVILSGLLIIIGGAGIFIGAYMVFSLVLIIIFLLAITFSMHNFWADKDPMTKINNKVNFAKNIALLGAALMMIALLL